MELLFYRKYPFQVRIQNQVQQFFAELGFFSPLNLETGMSANLPEIDQTFENFVLKNQEFVDLKEVLQCLQNYFSIHIKGAELKKIKIQQLDPISIHWDKGILSFSEVLIFNNLFEVEVACLDWNQIQNIKACVNQAKTESALDLMQILSPLPNLVWARVTDPSKDLSYWHTQSL